MERPLLWLEASWQSKASVRRAVHCAVHLADEWIKHNTNIHKNLMGKQRNEGRLSGTCSWAPFQTGRRAKKGPQ